MAAGGFVVGGGGLLVGGGGLDVGAAGFIVGLTGTMGFSVSVLGTGGQTRFSNLTERDSELVSEVGEVGLESGGAVLLDSHIFRREEMEPVLFRLSSCGGCAPSPPSSPPTVGAAVTFGDSPFGTAAHSFPRLAAAAA